MPVFLVIEVLRLLAVGPRLGVEVEVHPGVTTAAAGLVARSLALRLRGLSAGPPPPPPAADLHTAAHSGSVRLPYCVRNAGCAHVAAPRLPGRCHVVPRGGLRAPAWQVPWPFGWRQAAAGFVPVKAQRATHPLECCGTPMMPAADVAAAVAAGKGNGGWVRRAPLHPALPPLAQPPLAQSPWPERMGTGAVDCGAPAGDGLPRVPLMLLLRRQEADQPKCGSGRLSWTRHVACGTLAACRGGPAPTSLCQTRCAVFVIGLVWLRQGCSC